MNPQEKLQRLLKLKAAFPTADLADALNTLTKGLPFTAEEQQRVERGLTTESRFADVYSALDWTALIHGLDQWQLLVRSKDEWQVPDYALFVRFPNRSAAPVLVEAKLVTGQKKTFEISVALLEALEKYAAVWGVPLLIAIYWQALHLWTTHTPDQLLRSAKTARISLSDATQQDVSVVFSDTLLVIATAWRRRTTYDPNAEGFHLRDPKRGFIVDDYLAVDGTTFVQLSEVESGIINKIMRPKVLTTERDGVRIIVTTACTTDSVAKASSIVQLLLEEFEAFGEESEPARAFNTLARLKLNAGIPIQPYVPRMNTPQVEALFERTFGLTWSD